LTRAEFARTESARPQDIEHVQAFAAEFGLRAIRIRPVERTIALAGSVGSFARAFRVDLGQYELGGATYRGREGSIHLPKALAEGVIAVLGLDDRPAAERR
jgi:kumamolisin